MPGPVTAGDYRHAATGMVFPAEVAGFRRMDVARLDRDGSDAAVAYDFVAPAGEIAATVWLHRAPTMLTVGYSAEQVGAERAAACARALDRREDTMVRAHVDATPPRRRTVSIAKGGAERQGTLLTSRYTARFAGRTQGIETELTLFCYVGGDWILEFRFSAPERFDAAPRIAGFMGALDWTGLEG